MAHGAVVGPLQAPLGELSFFGFVRPVRELQFGAVFLTTRRLRAYLLKPV